LSIWAFWYSWGVLEWIPYWYLGTTVLNEVGVGVGLVDRSMSTFSRCYQTVF
jgi:hypothetical protein